MCALRHLDVNKRGKRLEYCLRLEKQLEYVAPMQLLLQMHRSRDLENRLVREGEHEPRAAIALLDSDRAEIDCLADR